MLTDSTGRPLDPQLLYWLQLGHDNWLWKSSDFIITNHPINDTVYFQTLTRSSNKLYSAWTVCLLVFGAAVPQWARANSFTRFLDHTEWRTTVGRTPLDEWSARRRDLYLTTHNTHNRQTSMTQLGFEPTISVVERPQTYALDRAANGTGARRVTLIKCYIITLSIYKVIERKR